MLAITNIMEEILLIMPRYQPNLDSLVTLFIYGYESAVFIDWLRFFRSFF